MEELLDDTSKQHVEMNLPQLMECVRKEMFDGNEDMQIFEKLQNILENVDFSLIDSVEFETSHHIPKRRKISRASSESNDGQLLEEIKKQIDIVKSALNVIYDIENRSFKKFISKDTVRAEHAHVDSGNFFERLKEHAQALPLWVDTDGEDPPPLCGSIKAEENHVSEVGDLVAALVDNKDDWILAEVTAYDPIKREYTVDDIYEEKQTEVVSWNTVVPLPKMRADPENNSSALFQKAEKVLALYPGTTCFYHAVVREMPLAPDEPYTLHFEGDQCMLKVHQRFVIHDVCHVKKEVKDDK